MPPFRLGNVALALLVLALECFFYVSTFLHYYRERVETRDIGLGIPVARAAAALLRLNLALLLALACRSLWTIVATCDADQSRAPLARHSPSRLFSLHRRSSRFLRRHVSTHAAIHLHKAVGFVVALCMTLHIVGHAFNYAAIARTPLRVVVDKYAVLLVDGRVPTFFDMLFGTIPGVTGVALTLVMVFILAYDALRVVLASSQPASS